MDYEFMKQLATTEATKYYNLCQNQLAYTEDDLHEYMRMYINTLSELNAKLHTIEREDLEGMRKRDLAHLSK